MIEFKDGQLLIPNNDIHQAFYYFKNQHNLVDGIEYKVATSKQRIYFEKNIKDSKKEITNTQDYKSQQSKKISAATAKNKNPHGRF
jgi:hypothetical protein